MDLTEAYYNGANVPNADGYYDRWMQEGAAYRATHVPRTIPYGATPREVFDVFEPADPLTGTLIFIHGGYWRSSDRTDWSQLAAGGVARGWRVVMPGYTLCPEITVPQITRQLVQAMNVIASRFDGPLRVTGHSAGGHLTARLLDPAWNAPWQARISKAVPISPLADLMPLLQTDMNADLRLTAETAQAESPIHQPASGVPVTVWVGADERPALLDQAQWLAAAWGCPKVIAPGRHHYDVIDDLKDPTSALCDALLG